MKKSKLLNFNRRIFLLLLALVVLFGIVFISQYMFLMSLRSVSEVSTINISSVVLTAALFVFIILVLLFWHFRTNKYYNLRVKRLKLVYIFSFIWLVFFIVFDIFVPYYIEYGISIFILYLAVLYFLFKSQIKSYHSKVLLSMTLSLGYIALTSLLGFILFSLKSGIGFNLKDNISFILAFLPAMLFKISIQLMAVFAFTMLVGFGKYGSSNIDEEMTDTFLENSYLDV